MELVSQDFVARHQHSSFKPTKFLISR